MRIDSLFGAEASNIGNRRLGALCEPPTVDCAEQRRQRGQLRPPGQDKAAISTGGTAAADVLFDDRDLTSRIELLDPNRSPEADIAAADNGDVGTGFARERRGHVWCVPQTLPEPERSMLLVHGLRDHSGTWQAVMRIRQL